MATKPIVMPQLGESVAEATLSKWYVKEGDVVVRDQTIAEAATDKADTELPAPLAGRITRLLVQVGETVPVNTPIAEIDTEAAAEKAPVQAPAAVRAAQAASSPAPAISAAPPGAGGPSRVRPEPESAGAGREPARPAPRPPPAAEPPGRESWGPKPPQEAVEAAAARREAAKPAPREAPRPAPREAPRPPPAARTAPDEERQRASPLVRRIARERGVDLSEIEGSGANGRVTKKDILEFLGEAEAGEGQAPPPIRAPTEMRPAAREVRAPAEPPAAAREARAPVEQPVAARPPTRIGEARTFAPTLTTYRPPEYRPLPGDEEVPFTRRRKLIAEHMVYSKHVSPHVPCMAEIDLHKVARARKEAAKSGTSLSFLTYFAAATIRAVREYPMVNATVLEDRYVLHKVINLGIAVDTDEGLVVPVIRNAADLSLVGLSRTINDLAEKARNGKLSADEVMGGTISISNPGPRGNVWGQAVISQPQVAILRMGEIIKRPVVITVGDEDAIVIRPIMDVVLSYDHRIIDGVAGNGFLRRIKELLEANPESF